VETLDTLMARVKAAALPVGEGMAGLRTASLPHERRRESGPTGSQGIFRTASIRSAATGWVAKNPPLPGPETCRSQVKVSIIISFG
jgi:hypothetical protein